MAIALCTLGSQAQQFTMTVDIISIAATDMGCDGTFKLSFIAKQKDKIYCLYENTIQVMVGKCPYNHLLSIDEMGQISRFPLPDDIKEDMDVGEGLFVRNDSLILRRYRSYHHAMFHVAWEKDHDYISLWSCGEWGTYVRFLSKKTHKDYIYRCKYVIKNEQKNGMTMIGSFTDVPIRVFKQTDGYYLITPKSMIRISDPSEGHIYQGEAYADVDNKHLYSEFTELVTSQSNIYACFMLNKQFYFIMESSSGICVATYRDGTISKVMDIDCNYTPYVHQSYMRDCDSPKDHTLLLLTDRKAGKDAILTVEGTKIHLRYLIYQ